MRITVFGGTGPTGLLLIDYALTSGHEVIAFARTPSKLPDHDRLTAIEGRLDDDAAINEAVHGSDAVLSLLGPGTKTDDVPPLITGYRNIVTAMRDQNVDRLVALGTPSMTDPSDSRDFKVGLMVKGIRTFQPVAYDAIVKIGQIVRDSELEWTLVRVPLLTNGPKTDTINVRAVGDRGGVRLSRTNAAAFILTQAADPTYLRRAPFISDK
ncbi:NAD(P)-dependent oxidoreductase [Nocardia aurea]|uniref:NAD(P)-dependent oxidoreductase n=1 Tax=Nocardia aurea TaxID=2144174 RepID=UPI001300A39B|nr:NAD(P)H-binding protein [Nocardia aurea]